MERHSVTSSHLLGELQESFFKKSRSHLHAIAVVEALVVNFNQEPNRSRLPYPVVAIYPRKGTLWADCPIGVV
jgi:hypothetical protein